jgi:hypothetical protein
MNIMDFIERVFASFTITFTSLIVFVFLYVAVATYNEVTGISCNNAAAIMNLESMYSFSTGCMLKVNGQFLPKSEVVPVERDGKIVFVPRNPTRIEVSK